MLMIEAIVKPNKLEAVKAALVQKGIVGAVRQIRLRRAPREAAIVTELTQ